MSRLSAIDTELQKCARELKMLGADMSTVPIGETKTLGAAFPSGSIVPLASRDPAGFKSFRTADHDPLNKTWLDKLRNMKSCQSCLSKPVSDATYYQFTYKQETMTLNEEPHQVYIHSTQNKNGTTKVSSVSVFKNGQFVAYLFTSNDFMAFDNFNSFHDSDPTQPPPWKCVEQMVFCEHKTLLNLYMLDKMDPTQFRDEIARAEFPTDPIKRAADLGIEPPQENEINPGIWNKELFNAYRNSLKQNLHKGKFLDRFKGYKKAGRDVISFHGYMNLWNSIQLMCAVTARMQQLKKSQTQHSLAAALVPACIVECSDEDDRWAVRVHKTQKLDMEEWFNVAGNTRNGSGPKDPETKVAPRITFEFNKRSRLEEVINQETFKQEEFIMTLKRYIDEEHTAAAFHMLFDGTRTGNLLGLSERLIQALWTKYLVFPPVLITMIEDRLGKYGIGYVHYTPDLIEISSGTTSHLAENIIKNIGTPVM